MLEAVVVGLLASLIGLGAGFGLAKGLVALLTVAGLDLPRSGLTLAPRTIAVSLVLGVVITVVAGLHPAVRATRVQPIAAVRVGATLPRGRRSNSLAIALLVVGAGLVGLGLFVHGPAVWIHIAAAGAGLLALFVGVAAGASRLVGPLARVLGRAVGARAGAAGRLARENASRNPGRTAATAAALMVGLALVTCLSAFSKGLLRSHTVDVTRQLRADDTSACVIAPERSGS